MNKPAPARPIRTIPNKAAGSPVEGSTEATTPPTLERAASGPADWTPATSSAGAASAVAVEASTGATATAGIPAAVTPATSAPGPTAAASWSVAAAAAGWAATRLAWACGLPAGACGPGETTAPPGPAGWPAGAGPGSPGVPTVGPVGTPTGTAHAPVALLATGPPTPAARPVGAAKHGFVPPVPLTEPPPAVGRPPLALTPASLGRLPVGTVDSVVPSGGAVGAMVPSGPPPLRVLAVAQLPDALLLAGPPTPTAAPVGAAAHGVTPPDVLVAALVSCELAVPFAMASVGAVASGAVDVAMPPSGAAAADAASAGVIGGALPAVVPTLAVGTPPLDVVGCVVRVVAPARVGTVNIGTTAGATPAAGVSLVGSVAAFAAPLGSDAMAQLPCAAALAVLLTPIPALVGATTHGSVAAVESAVTLVSEASAPAPAVVGLVACGSVAPTTAASGSPATRGATSASVASAIGLETSGAESTATFAAALLLVNGAEVSGGVTLASTVDGAVTTGAAWVASAAAAGAVLDLAGCGAVAAALAPDGPADDVVLNPLDGLETRTLGCDDTFGLVAAVTETFWLDVLTVGLAVLTLMVVGALTGGALPVDTGATCAATGGAAATNSNRAVKPLNDLFVKRCM